MDKDKLMEWLKLNIDASPIVFKLMVSINIGVFDKEPCDVCNKAGRSFGDYGDCDIDGNVLKIDCSEVNYHSTATIEYCPMCGRKLEDTNHD
jgi:hypothetical protein